MEQEHRGLKKVWHSFTKAERSWIAYDWANSVYATNIMAAIFPIYFAMVATDMGNKWYGIGVSISSLIVALLAPILGSVGDIKGYKKKLLTAFMLIGVVFTAVMALFNNWEMMLIGYIISRIGFSGSCVFYDAFLTDVTTDERMDRVSAWGYAMGYIGGSTIPFVISIIVLIACNYSTFSLKFSILIVSVWWLLFSIPILKNVHQKHYIEAKASTIAKTAWTNFMGTLKGIVKGRGLLIFMLAYFFYIDGVDTIISLATNYGTTLGLGSTGMIAALLVTQIVAVPCSILFSRLAKRFHAVKMIIFAIAVYFMITFVGFFMGRTVEPYQLKYNAEAQAVIAKYTPEGMTEADEKIWDSLAESITSDGKEYISKTGTEREQAYFGSYTEGGKTGLIADLMLRLEDPKGQWYDDVKYTQYVFSSEAMREKVYGALEGIRTDSGFRSAVLNEEFALAGMQAAATASTLFWVLAALVGTVQGGIQALSRSYYARLVPPEHANEYFGFFDIFAKFAAVIGPLLYAGGYILTGRASFGILSLLLLFALGGCLLIFGYKTIRKTEEEVKARKLAAGVQEE